jgi:hypothetical protein
MYTRRKKGNFFGTSKSRRYTCPILKYFLSYYSHHQIFLLSLCPLVLASKLDLLKWSIDMHINIIDGFQKWS